MKRGTSAWSVVTGKVEKHGICSTQCLRYSKLDHSIVSIDLPASIGGVICEVCRIPSDAREVRVESGSQQGMPLPQVEIRKVGLLEAYWRMFRRVLGALYSQPSNKKHAIGLSFWKIFYDLVGQYSAAGRMRACALAPAYTTWIQSFDTLTREDREKIHHHIGRFRGAPFFEIVICTNGEDLGPSANTLTSVEKQIYRNFSFKTTSWTQLSGCQLHRGRDTYVMLINAGDQLAEHALYWAASILEHSSSTRVIYADEDRLDSDGRRTDPCFKSDWSRELLRSMDYLGGACFIRSDDLAMTEGYLSWKSPADMHIGLLQICEGLEAEEIVHIPAVLVHRRAPDAFVDNSEILNKYLEQHDERAVVTQIMPGRYRVKYALPEPLPMVSILIPTRDGLDMLSRCVESVRRESCGRNIEIIIIDNRSSAAGMSEYFTGMQECPDVRVMQFDAPFNFSAINNFAAQHANGEVLCLLNNDTEVISPDWLEEMLGHLIQDKVGVVGAKLLYPDGRVQHGGDAVGVGGVANHLHAFLDRDDPGYCNRAIVAQDLSAVTAACLMTWRKLYLDLGGMDEKNLPVAFNDVDYCLRVREAGHRVVWTPHAQLYHHESVSRGKDDTQEKKRRAKREVAYMRKRWKKELEHDPFYNPNLSYQRADFSLSHAPLVRKPWQA